MEKASGHRRLAPAILVALVATAVVLAPLPAAAQRRPAAPPPPHTQTEPSPKPEAAAATIADDSAETLYACDIEDRMGNDEEDMFLDCDGNDDIRPLILDNGNTLTYRAYWEWEPKVTCKWKYAGNIMSGVVVWDLQWPGARSCRVAMQGGDAPCKVVFENRAVTFVTPAGRRVLGDVAIKECSKNWGGFGSLVPFGLGCTYPEHEHPYVGTIEE